jgi:hypothetical protein
MTYRGDAGSDRHHCDVEHDVSVVSVALGDADGDIVVDVAVDGDNVGCETQWKAV